MIFIFRKRLINAIISMMRVFIHYEVEVQCNSDPKLDLLYNHDLVDSLKYNLQYLQ